MELEINLTNTDSRYAAQVSVLRVTSAEQEKLTQFGDPLVEIGGTFTGSVTRPGEDTPVSVTFTLSARAVRLPSGFPVKRVFDLVDSADADVQAKVWADTIKTRMTTAKTTLMAQVSPLEGRTVTTI
jgi:hypothetical protein